mgnify:CR=1 FL=1
MDLTVELYFKKQEELIKETGSELPWSKHYMYYLCIRACAYNVLEECNFCNNSNFIKTRIDETNRRVFVARSNHYKSITECINAIRGSEKYNELKHMIYKVGIDENENNRGIWFQDN